MRSPSEQKQRSGHIRGLNVVVYSLVGLAVFLGGLAGWQRYSGKVDAADAAEQQLDAVLSGLGISGGWVHVGGASPTPAGAPMCGFVCQKCQVVCRTRSGVRSPVCPFCGVVMRRQAGFGISPVGGTTAAGGPAFPIPIPPGALAPHRARGRCMNCHTPAATSMGQTATPTNAAKPVLIEEIGIEVGAAGGAGATVTGVMGNSFATRAGLQTGDVIIEFNRKAVGDAAQLDQLVTEAPPEMDASVRVIRNGRMQDLSVMIGQGEMDGFTAIQR